MRFLFKLFATYLLLRFVIKKIKIDDVPPEPKQRRKLEGATGVAESTAYFLRNSPSTWD